ncbi:hypothetical protein YC2023_055372 [Brassica napus]
MAIIEHQRSEDYDPSICRKEDEAFYQYKSRTTVILLLPCSGCMFPLLCDS